VTPPLNLPAPGRCQAIFVILTISHSHMFLVNSRLGHFSAPASPRDPLSLSYGVNLPSSLAVIHSSALGYSPHPPVSVYGTGGPSLVALSLFSRVWLPALSARPGARRTFGSRSPYTLQRGIPSPRGSVTPRSRLRPTGRLRNIDRMCIGCALRPPLSSRLTRGRLAWPRKPWVFGGGVSTPLVVTHAYIFFSGRSRKPRGSPSAPTGMLPYHAAQRSVLGFGVGLDARSSSTRLRSTSELLRTL
jgi:hypothetical protein